MKTMRMLKVSQRITFYSPGADSGSLSRVSILGVPRLDFFFSPVGDLFRLSLTLTCWPTLARSRQAVTATAPVSLEMETEMRRVVITAPPSFCQRPCCWSRCHPPIPPPTSSPPPPHPGVQSIFFPLSYRSVGKKNHPEINLPDWCPVVELCLTGSPERISGITRCSLLQRDEKKKKTSGVSVFLCI